MAVDGTPRLWPKRWWRSFETYLGQPIRSGVCVFLVLLPIYLASTNWEQVQANDTVATVYPAHQLAFNGTLFWDEPPVENRWFIPVERGWASNRFIGTILHAVPAYRLLGDPDEVTAPPGALAASVIAALAMVALHLCFRRVASPAAATVAALVAGLATSTWGISASAMWTHGPGQLWLALATLAIAHESYGRAGFAYAVALTVRPQNAVIAAATGLVRGVQNGSVRPVVVIGSITSIAAAALVAYNRVVFASGPPERSSTIAGGYGSAPLDRLLGTGPVDWLTSIVGLLASPSKGFLVLSPFLLVLAVAGLRPAWRHAPSWVRAAAISGAAYLLVQTRVNDFDGGANQLVYRLPLEALTVAAPLLLLAYRHGVRERPVVEPIFWATVTFSVGLQAVAAIPWDIAYRRAGGPIGFSLAEWERALELAGPIWPVGILAASVVTGLAARHLRGMAA